MNGLKDYSDLELIDEIRNRLLAKLANQQQENKKENPDKLQIDWVVKSNFDNPESSKVRVDGVNNEKE